MIKTVRFTLKKIKLYDGERSKALVAAAALWISNEQLMAEQYRLNEIKNQIYIKLLQPLIKGSSYGKSIL